MSEQLVHKNTHFTKAPSNSVLVCDMVTSPANIGGLFRLCDALGVAEIFFCGTTINLETSRIKRTSRNTHKNIPYQDNLDCISTINNLSNKGYFPLLLELTNKSKALSATKISEKKPLAIIIGNEKHGVSNSVLERVSMHVHIEMLGVNSSMNVTQAAAIGLYTLINKQSSHLDKP